MNNEPVGLIRTNGKRPDGATLIPWVKGKLDVTIIDTFAESRMCNTSTLAREAVNKAAAKKISQIFKRLNNTSLHSTRHGNSRTYNNLAVDVIKDIGKRTSAVTKELLVTSYLFQRMSMAIQWENVVSFTSTFKTE